MKSELEIKKKMLSFLKVISLCNRECGGGPTGSYCYMCNEMMSRYESLEWVIGEEGQLKKELRESWQKVRDEGKGSEVISPT